jgi:hypothetical protein
MSEMVKRVANAIRAPIDDDDCTYEEIARAAISAMRDPTEEVLKLVFEAGSGGTLCAWHVMIDKILEGQ